MKFKVLPTLLVCLLSSACRPGDFSGQTYEALCDQAVAAGLPGVALFVSGPDGEFDLAAGESEIGVKDYAPSDVFRIASNSKSFLGVVAAQLADEGALDLDAPMRDHLAPALVSNIANADTATLRQALLHTSGIPDYLGEDGFWDEVDNGRTEAWTAEEALVYAYGVPAVFAPGTDWDYSNTNYLLAGLVIDAVAGRHHSAEIRNRILDPLAMSRSAYEVEEPDPGTLVHGYAYYFGADEFFDTSALEQGYGLADGGMLSTASDLGTYVRALAVGDELLTDGARAILFDGVAPGDDEVYGLGISVFSTDFGDAVGHGGLIEGYLSDMFHYPDDDVTIVAFTNTSAGDFDGDFDPEGIYGDFLVAVEDLTFE